jgi:hypothetical protein
LRYVATWIFLGRSKWKCWWEFWWFQVIRGGDGMAGFAVRHPSGQMVHPYQW